MPDFIKAILGRQASGGGGLSDALRKVMGDIILLRKLNQVLRRVLWRLKKAPGKLKRANYEPQIHCLIEITLRNRQNNRLLKL